MTIMDKLQTQSDKIQAQSDKMQVQSDKLQKLSHQVDEVSGDPVLRNMLVNKFPDRSRCHGCKNCTGTKS